MKIDYLSDTHFDVHLGVSKALEYNFETIFEPIFKNKSSDTLIIAGDIGEFNDQNIIALQLVRDKIKYKNIILVLGNHDLFLPNVHSKKMYQDKYYNRVNEFKELILDEEGIHLLDGSFITIDGVTIGGCMGWYDGIYSFHNLNPYYTLCKEQMQELWMGHPDFRYIDGLDTYDQ